MAVVTRRPRLLAACSAGLVAAVLLIPTAGATRLDWQETARDGKQPVLRFRITSLTFGTSRWSAHVSFANVSQRTIRVGERFGVAIYADGKTSDVQKAIGFAAATTFSPGRPASLKPGAAWTGVIGGTGRLVSSRAVRYARVVFGPLTGIPGQTRAVFWITDHSLPLAPPARGPVI